MKQILEEMENKFYKMLPLAYAEKAIEIIKETVLNALEKYA